MPEFVGRRPKPEVGVVHLENIRPFKMQAGRMVSVAIDLRIVANSHSLPSRLDIFDVGKQDDELLEPHRNVVGIGLHLLEPTFLTVALVRVLDLAEVLASLLKSMLLGQVDTLSIGQPEEFTILGLLVPGLGSAVRHKTHLPRFESLEFRPDQVLLARLEKIPW